MAAKIKVTILGRVIGTASGWDEVGDQCLSFYDFAPAKNVDLQKCSSISVSFDSGVIEGYDDKGESVIFSKDAVDIIKSIPKE